MPDASPDPALAERRRLEENAAREKNWQRWGPYLPERQWGTVREDYSADGSAWDYFPHDHARSRAYRWGEDGLLGWTDRKCRVAFAVALWNGRDPILKERLFGLTGPEGNHGEDVKELYYYLDATPTHSYNKALYKYPQAAFPYDDLVAENGRRGRDQPEYELLDTGVFEQDRYFDVFVEYAKADPHDTLIRIRVVNRGPDAAELHVLPQLWLRNAWVWGCRDEGCTTKPWMERRGDDAVALEQETLGAMVLRCGPGPGGEAAELLLTENETNDERLFGTPNPQPYVKDAFHRRVIEGEASAVNPEGRGTKAGAWYRLKLEPGQEREVRLRLAPDDGRAEGDGALGAEFERVFAQRIAEADAFYAEKIPAEMNDAQRRVARQAYAGLLWTRQFYHLVAETWLAGDPNMPDPPPGRQTVRNTDWGHLFNRDVLSMPDKWEYPWYAAWDLAFHMIPFAWIDPQFAKDQLILLLREWYMHPNGQIPAYEYAFSDVNPPVHAYACWRVYKMTAPRGERDRAFLASAFQKLLLNFTWWVNRKDPDGRHLFAGGFLGLDNIGVFDRSRVLPGGHRLEQADATAWMAFYCTTMLGIALELATQDPVYEDMASKFFEHFVAIADAINHLGGCGLWDDQDGFFYDQLHTEGGATLIKARSLVGLIPLIAVEVLRAEQLERLPGFAKRMRWFLENRPEVARGVIFVGGDAPGSGGGGDYLLAIPSREKLTRVLGYLLDPEEFLSPFGVRSLSKHHDEHPVTIDFDGERATVRYEPGESQSEMFGGNSNWRGPIWLPVNYLLIEALQRYHLFYGDGLTVECPMGSGKRATLGEVAAELERRVARLFVPDGSGVRPCHGAGGGYEGRPGFEDLVLFHEYFHGETGRGLGASHQTGWTALIVRLMQDLARRG